MRAKEVVFLTDDTEAKLKALGYELPRITAGTPGYIERVKRVGNILFVSGHGPQKRDGGWIARGRVGKDVALEVAGEAARLCVLGCLSSVKAAIGSLDRLDQVIQVRGFVSSATDFFNQPAVMDYASKLLIELLGDRGRHARTAIGTSALPENICVEVDMVVSVR